MSQLSEARETVAEIGRVSDELKVLHAKLNDVLGRAQNRPPEGEADGTISSDDYTSLRSLERQLVYGFSSLEGARRV